MLEATAVILKEFRGNEFADEQSTYEFALDICQKIKKRIGIPISIGIGPTKTLAKVANYTAKKLGVQTLDLSDAEKREKILDNMTVDNVWGIGRNIALSLNEIGVYTAKQLIASDPRMIRDRFSVVGERMIRELRGEVCYPLCTEVARKKMIISSRSFGRAVTLKAELAEALANYAARGCIKLRSQASKAGSIGIKIRTSVHKDRSRFFSKSIEHNLLEPTNDTRVIIKLALALLDKAFKPGHKYSKAEIWFYNLQYNDTPKQLDMFAPPPLVVEERGPQLMELVDSVTRKLGDRRLFFAAQGTKRAWAMKRGHASPQYTTNWADLPLAR